MISPTASLNEYLPDDKQIRTGEDNLERSNDRSSGYTIRTPSEILDMEFDNSDNLLGDRLLEVGSRMTFIGQGGIGKSFLVLQAACCCITGRKFLGFETRAVGRKWLIFQAENSNRRLQRDLIRFKRWLTEDEWNLVCECLKIHTLETDDDFALNLDNPANDEKIRIAIADHDPLFVVFDPLKDFSFGNLNSDQDMHALCQSLNQCVKYGNADRVVIVLHHSLTGTAGAQKAVGFDRSSFGRNSKVLYNWTRSQINFAPGTEDYQSLVVSCGKCNDGLLFPEFAVTRDPDSLIFNEDDGFDLDNWRTDISGARKGGQQKKYSPDIVRTVVAKTPDPITKKVLYKLVMDESGCSKAVAYRLIDQAVKRNFILRSTVDDTYQTIKK